MIVITRNSVYKLTTNPPGSKSKFTVEKTEDLYPHGHPGVRVGDLFHCDEVYVRAGRPMELRRMVAHDHKGGWRYCRSEETGHYPDVTTSTVVDIAEEKR